MNYVLDTHTHTIVSGHAYTTWLENIKWASENGIEVLATTDHGPNMPGGPHIFYFNNLKTLPRELYGVIHLRGCEANIVDYEGNLDIPQRTQANMDILIASLHDVCIKAGSREENTKALINAMNNPLIDIMGHTGNTFFPIYEEEVVKKAKAEDKIIEINNSSFKSRPGSEATCLKIAKLCADYGVKIVLSSDAHVCFNIGKFPIAQKIIEEAKVPEELILNTNKDKILIYLKKKGKLSDLSLD
ncbi:phosphatase [Clostridium manihotivorum]|uniref:Phosphatase n=1 Tax=Clostridium manihotivorum TaxID=2320868 RepID=A0A3R5TJJ5_9CLOT|nr:phosphatase [Clostridium manihotivorum]QAA34969.1 phosphatase [Clostridium manihotivorum]